MFRLRCIQCFHDTFTSPFWRHALFAIRFHTGFDYIIPRFGEVILTDHP